MKTKKVKKEAQEVIKIALEVLRADTLKRAEDYARQDAARVWKIVEECGFDQNAVEKKLGFYSEDSKLARRMSNNNWRGELMTYNEKGVEYYVKEEIRNVNLIFDKYVFKLSEKVGPVTSAELLTGGNLWSYSDLKVVQEDGQTEVWTTRQIWNRSVKGKMFPQFPTRAASGKRVTPAPKNKITDIKQKKLPLTPHLINIMKLVLENASGNGYDFAVIEDELTKYRAELRQMDKAGYFRISRTNINDQWVEQIYSRKIKDEGLEHLKKYVSE